MSRHSMIEGDPLWVPLLTHYSDCGDIDHVRMTAHLEQVAADVSQIMLAGSTGDGWELDDRGFQSLIDFASRSATGKIRIMFGALAPNTETVIARIKMIEDRLPLEPDLRQRYVGVTVCPPVDPEATQFQIMEHYRKILRHTSSYISVYQLPQITGCTVAPVTVQKIAEDPRVIMFKDSSGVDEVAVSGLDYAPAVMLRGAEGGYAEAVTGGGYGGWLLSTANVFGDSLRQIETALRSDRPDQAKALSDRLGGVVMRLFEAAADEGGANNFSNANRAADHLRAHGARWKAVPPPVKQNGDPLSIALIATAAEICEGFIPLDKVGYLIK